MLHKSKYIDKSLFYKDIGIVDAIGDGIVSIKGLNNVANGEMIIFCVGNYKIAGLVLNLSTNRVSAIVLGKDINIKPGHHVIRKYSLMSVPTGQSLLGRVVDH